jgi:hypothetical protein
MVRSTEWKSWKLRKRATIPLALVDVGIIVAILTLERISATRNGIATIRSIPSAPTAHFSLANSVWSYGLLWTALPAFLMTLFHMAWEAVVTASADRQPFVELARPEDEAASMKRTVMLDYRNYPSWYSWLVAFRRGHHIIGVSLLLGIVLSVALVPLTSHLLTAAATVALSNITGTIPSVFDDQAINAQTDLQSAMNVAGAVSIFGASPPPWATEQYAFEPFDISQLNKSGNISTIVNAYSGLLDCEIKATADYRITYSSGTVTIDGTDRGCAIPSIQIIVSTNVSLYALPWSTLQCDSVAHYSRFGIITARSADFAPDKLENLTVLSCIPSYWRSSGRLTVEHAPGKTPVFADFVADENNVTEIRPFFYKVLENTLPDYTAFDPSNTFETDAWGRFVYQLASRRNITNPLDSQNIQSAMETLFSSFFASLASTSLFQPVTNAIQVDATFAEQVTRLFVVSPVAWTVAIILCLVLICNGFLIIYSEKNHSMLEEEPKGLLGSAVLLQDSGLFDLLSYLRGSPPAGIPVKRALKDNHELESVRCWYDAEAKLIRVSGLPVAKGIENTKSGTVPLAGSDGA